MQGVAVRGYRKKGGPGVIYERVVPRPSPRGGFERLPAGCLLYTQKERGSEAVSGLNHRFPAPCCGPLRLSVLHLANKLIRPVPGVPRTRERFSVNKSRYSRQRTEKEDRSVRTPVLLPNLPSEGTSPSQPLAVLNSVLLSPKQTRPGCPPARTPSCWSGLP